MLLGKGIKVRVRESDCMDVRKYLEQYKGRKALAENEVKELLKGVGIPTTNFELIKEEKDIDKLKLPLPYVMKVCSADILHKTDVGGVRLGLKSKEEVKNAFHELRKKFPNEKFLVESMEKSGVEGIIGLLNDATFGPAIMFGLGGIFTELFKDVTFRIVPIGRSDAEEMISEIKGAKLLEGFRGIKVDRNAIIDTLMKVSKIAEDGKGLIDSLDLNPIFVREDGLVVVDAKLILNTRKD